MSYRYIYDIVNEEQRNLLQHNILKSKTKQLMVEILENYGLKQSLETAAKNKSKVQILDVGCGDGYFLQDLADLLEGYKLLSAAELTGIDINDTYLAKANKQSLTKASWGRINYYNADITQPLEHNYNLRSLGKLQFDCICATMVMQFLPNAQQLILNLYKYLKLGGVLYLCDNNMLYGTVNGWKGPNAAFDKFGPIATAMVRGINGGIVIATETANWLQEAGAKQVQVISNIIQATGGDQASLDALRFYISVVRSVTPVLRDLGLINQVTQEEILAGVFKVSKDDQAQLPYIHTLARKPLEK